MEKKKETKLSLVDRQSIYNMIIPEDVQKKIREWCYNLPSLEWSGVLFYTVSGDFADGTLTITCKDFYVCDIGSGVYTEFYHGADIIAYADENDLLDCFQGLIH